MAEQSDITFGGRGETREGPRNHVLVGHTYGYHIANRTEQSVLGGDVG